MIKVIGLFFLFIFSFISYQAKADFNMYVGMLAGEQALRETQASAVYNHDSQFFIGHMGILLGGGYTTPGMIGVGVKGEVSWVGNSVDRKQVDTTSSTGYRNEFLRLLSGVVVSIKPGPVSIELEYYPWVSCNTTYSDGSSVNPFRKNDNLKATGYGIGLGFKFFPPMKNFITFRRLNYNRVDMNGTATDLPNDTYSTLNFEEVVFGFGSEF